MQFHAMPGHILRRLHQVSTQTFARHMQAAGIDLTPVQFAAMAAILETPGLDQAGVASLIGYDRATIGGVIDRLIQKGLVVRRVSSRDRRAREVFLTEAGQALHTEALPIVDRVQDAILDALSARERTLFLGLAVKALGPDAPPGALPAR